MTKFRIACALAAASLVLAACSGGSHSMLPSAGQLSSGRSAAGSGTGNGVAAPVANPTSLTFTSVGASSAQTFTVTVQFAGDLTAVSSNTSVATVTPSTASPVVTPTGGGTKSATFTVTPVGGGSATITVTDKKGGVVTISVTVTLGATHLFVANGSNGLADNIFVFDPLADGNVSPAYAISTTYRPTAGVDQVNDIESGSDGTVYELHWNQNGIMAFAGNAQGSSNPLLSIFGSNTMISQNTAALAVDGANNIYEAQNPAGTNTPNFPAIVKFASGSNGNASPIADLPGFTSPYSGMPATQINVVKDIAVRSDGTLYVANLSTDTQGYSTPGNILVFAPGATGNVAPAATIGGSNTRINFAYGVSVDSSGRIYVLTDDSVYATGYPLPSRLAVNPRICVFAPGASGNVLPVAVIEGAATGLQMPTKMRVDASGGIYVADHQASAVFYYAPGANGDIAPARAISGSNTGFGQNGGIDVIGL